MAFPSVLSRIARLFLSSIVCLFFSFFLYSAANLVSYPFLARLAILPLLYLRFWRLGKLAINKVLGSLIILLLVTFLFLSFFFFFSSNDRVILVKKTKVLCHYTDSRVPFFFFFFRTLSNDLFLTVQ